LATSRRKHDRQEILENEVKDIEVSLKAWNSDAIEMDVALSDYNLIAQLWMQRF
jgi:hypothetical protein